MGNTKAKRTIKQNRPGWKKVRGWGRKAIKTSRGLKKNQHGHLGCNTVKIKTSVWEAAHG